MRKDQVKDRLGKQDVYQPANDEPCVFTNTHRHPVSAIWVTWYIRNNPRTSLIQAYQRGEEVVRLLENEEPRHLDSSVEPVKFVEVLVGNFTKRVARLEWIIWYRYTRNVGYGSAYHAGVWGGQRSEQ